MMLRLGPTLSVSWWQGIDHVLAMPLGPTNGFGSDLNPRLRWPPAPESEVSRLPSLGVQHIFACIKYMSSSLVYPSLSHFLTHLHVRHYNGDSGPEPVRSKADLALTDARPSSVPKGC